MTSKIKRVLGCKYVIMISRSDFEHLSRLYDDLYEKAMMILLEYDPCRIKDDRCLRGEPCCDECGHLSKEKGCMVKSLACKLWLCDEAREVFPECAAALDELEKLATNHRLLGYRASKKDIFADYEIEDE